MNPKRRALFGLSLAPLVALPKVVCAEPVNAEPLRGEMVDRFLIDMDGRHPVMTDYVFLIIDNSALGGSVFKSARFVEQEIAGKREYVMTFTRESK